MGTLPRIPDGIHDGNGSGNVEHSPDRDTDFRDHDGQWDHDAVEQEC